MAAIETRQTPGTPAPAGPWERALRRAFPVKRALRGMQPCGELPSQQWLLAHAFKIAWPSTLESFLVALVSVVDTIMVGRLGASAIAAVGLTNQPKFVGLAVFLSLNVAVSAIVARRKGEGDREGANRVLVQAMLLVAGLTLLVSSLFVAFAEPILQLAGSNEDTHLLAASYFRIIMGGMFFNVMSLVINAAQRGCGNTRIALRTNVTSNLVNIVLNYLLIEGHFGFPALGVRGAALATVCGTVVALVMSVCSVLHPEGFLYLFLSTNRPRFDRRTLATIGNIGSATLAEQLFLRFGFLTYAMMVARLGTNAFAAHQIGMNIITISFSFGDGLSIASVALVGQSLGEKRPDLARIYGSYCQRMGFLCSTLLAVVYLFFGQTVFGFFTSEAPVLAYGGMIMRLVCVIVYTQIAQVIFSGGLRGAGDTRYVAMVGLVSVAIMRPLSGWVFIYALDMGLLGAWLGLLLDQSIRLLLTFVRFRSGRWMKIQI